MPIPWRFRRSVAPATRGEVAMRLGCAWQDEDYEFLGEARARAPMAPESTPGPLMGGTKASR